MRFSLNVDHHLLWSCRALMRVPVLAASLAPTVRRASDAEIPPVVDIEYATVVGVPHSPMPSETGNALPARGAPHTSHRRRAQQEAYETFLVHNEALSRAYWERQRRAHCLAH